ncbi:MAG: hypothetical protein ACP5Q0_02825, partial [Halothiobacillus sp.]
MNDDTHIAPIRSAPANNRAANYTKLDTQAEPYSARSFAMHTPNPCQKKYGRQRLAQLGLLALSLLTPMVSAQAAVTVDQSPL